MKATILGPSSFKFPSTYFQKRSFLWEQNRTESTSYSHFQSPFLCFLSPNKSSMGWPFHSSARTSNSYSLPTVWHVFIVIIAKEHIPLTALNTYHPYPKVLVKNYRKLNQFLQWAEWFRTQLLSVQHSPNFISNGRRMCTVVPVFPNNWTRHPITQRNHSNGFPMLLDKVDCFQFSVNKLYYWNRHLSWIILLQWSKTMGYLWFCYLISSSTSRAVLVTASRVFICCFWFLSFQFGF